MGSNTKFTTMVPRHWVFGLWVNILRVGVESYMVVVAFNNGVGFRVGGGSRVRFFG